MAEVLSAAGGPESLLKEIRVSIDNIDAALVHLLAERFRCTQTVGRLKAQHGMPPADPAREKQQIARLRKLADEAQLDPDFAEKFLNFIIHEVIRHHEMLAAEKKAEVLPAGSGRGGVGTEISDGLDKGPVLGSDDDLPTQQMG